MAANELVNVQKIANRRIPGLNLIRERAKLPPEGHRAISGPESVRRIKPLVDGIVSGAVPLDQDTKDAYAHVAHAEYQKFKRIARG